VKVALGEKNVRREKPDFPPAGWLVDLSGEGGRQVGGRQIYRQVGGPGCLEIVGKMGGFKTWRQKKKKTKFHLSFEKL
jgi:hypothetical protein